MAATTLTRLGSDMKLALVILYAYHALGGAPILLETYGRMDACERARASSELDMAESELRLVCVPIYREKDRPW